MLCTLGFLDCDIVDAIWANTVDPLLFPIFGNTWKTLETLRNCLWQTSKNIYFTSKPFRIWDSSLSALAQGFLCISFIDRKHIKYIENGLHVDLKFYNKSFVVPSGLAHGIASISFIKALPLWKCRLQYCCGPVYPIITCLIEISHPIGQSVIGHRRCYKTWLKRTLLEASIATCRCDLDRWSMHVINGPHGIAISQSQKVKALPLGFPDAI